MEFLSNPRTNKVSLQAISDFNLAFDSAFKRMKKTTPGNLAAWKELESKSELILHRVYVDAYYAGCKEADIHADTMTVLRFRRQAQDRAKQVHSWMRDWTLKNLGIHAVSKMQKKKNRLLGDERAENAATHEVFTAFFSAKEKAWGANKELMKRSLTSGDHDKDDLCDDNEDDGLISVDEAFTSGDMFPPYHFACECLISIRRQ